MNCAVAGTIWVSSDDSARMFIGCRMWVRASATIAAGMVAENSIVCRVSGVMAIEMRSTSGRKPRSSISSASSRTSACTWERSSARRLARSMSRPGVPTTMSTPRSSASSCGVVADAAVDGEHAQAAVLAGEVEVVGDLERELAGRGHDQGLRLALRQLGVVGVLGGDAALQHRDAEGQGLAGARAGLADQVGAHQGDREGHLLDGEGGGDAGALERVADLGGPRALGRWSVILFAFVMSLGQVLSGGPGVIGWLSERLVAAHMGHGAVGAPDRGAAGGIGTRPSSVYR